MKHYKLFLLITLCFLVGCKKDGPAKNLPPITQEGRNTAGFLLNGEIWVPYAECGLFQDPCKEINARYGKPSVDPNEVELLLSRVADELQSSLRITAHFPIKKTGEYYDSVNISFLSESQNINLRSFSKSSDYPNGHFTITRLDTVAQVMAGTFSFTLSNREGKTVEITEGRFDFKMDACVCSE